MRTKIKIFIVDDHQMFREGLRKVLSESQSITIVGEAANGQEFLDNYENAQPDVVLMDISMPVLDGIETTRQAIIQNPNLKIIALSMYGDQDYYYKMIHAGVKGFVLKKSGKKELENAITKVAQGESFFSNELLRNIIINLSHTSSEVKSPDTNMALTKRETEVLKLICKGFTNNEIAEELHLSPKTIDTHRLNILSKTGSKNSVSLVLYAIKNKLIDIMPS